jgi:hypothetical protein
MPGPELDIARLQLRVGGIDADTARLLGPLVADRLAAGSTMGPGGAAIDRLGVELTARPCEDPAALAQRICDRVLALIGRAAATEAGR